MSQCYKRVSLLLVAALLMAGIPLTALCQTSPFNIRTIPLTPLRVVSVPVRPVYTPPAHNGQYGQTTFFGNAYQPPAHNGQSGSVTYFGAPPVTYSNHNGQMGNVTFLAGARPYSTAPSHSGQSGAVTFIAPPGCNNPTMTSVGGITQFVCH